MGHLFSRAFKRLTQCTSSSSNSSNQQSARNQTQQPATGAAPEQAPEPKPVEAPEPEQQDDLDDEAAGANSNESELIPVGKSIDADEFVAAENGAKQEEEEGSVEPSTKDVEGAVIKIQALVRGHLTRKALKDAHHQHHSLPYPQALGQSQFDEESLTSGPPSAIFSTASPLAMGAGFQPAQARQQQQQKPANNSSGNNNGNKTPLESIAEAMETTSITTTTSTMPTQLVPEGTNREGERKRLMKLCTRSATSPGAADRLETPPTGADGGREPSASPVPSEANASIDLNASRAGSCDTPASCSIDILDHNIKPTDKLATVLHHQHQHHQPQPPQPSHPLLQAHKPTPGQPNQEPGDRTRRWVEEEGQGEESAKGVGATSADLEEEEAAAIRIQSAFRGYRTRKNSPYRQRSPSSAGGGGAGGGAQGGSSSPRHELEVAADRQQGAGQEGCAPNPERRLSRPRQRDCDDMLAQQLAPAIQPTPVAIAAATITADDHSETATVLESSAPALVMGSSTESAPGAAAAAPALGSIREGGAEVSLDLTEANVSELDSSQAVTVDSSLLLDNGASQGAGQLPKSQASTELDTTDSSILGGPALSLDMAEPVTDLSTQIGTAAAATNTTASAATTTTSTATAAAAAVAALAATETEAQTRRTSDEDKSLGATSLMMEEADEAEEAGDEEEDGAGRRLVDDTDQGCALVEEAASGTGADGRHEGDEGEDERELDQLLKAAAEEVEGVLNEEEQLAIELESDDIERRDPRGQASEERAKSPQIRQEPPQFAAAAATAGGDASNNNDDDDNNNNNNTSLLRVETVGGEGASSGRSSPIQNSSNGNSSEGEEDSEEDSGDNNNGEARSPTHQHQLQQQQAGGAGAKRSGGTASRNKKRNNRNKRKGKK